MKEDYYITINYYNIIFPIKHSVIGAVDILFVIVRSCYIIYRIKAVSLEISLYFIMNSTYWPGMMAASHLGTTTSTSNRTLLLTPKGGCGNIWSRVPMRETLPKETGPIVLLVLERTSSDGGTGEAPVRLRRSSSSREREGVIWNVRRRLSVQTLHKHVDKMKTQYRLWVMTLDCNQCAIVLSIGTAQCWPASLSELVQQHFWSIWSNILVRSKCIIHSSQYLSIEFSFVLRRSEFI